MKISYNQLKTIIKDIENDDSWVNDSHSESEYKGMMTAIKIITDSLNKIQGEK